MSRPTVGDIPGAFVEAPPVVRDRPEARLERELLRAVGSAPDLANVLVMKNEVGLGYRGALKGVLCEQCAEAAKRHRIHYGLGVGSPDLVAVPRGVFVGLELKADGGRPSEDQERWHAAARAKDVEIVVVSSVEQGLAALRRVMAW